MRVTTPKQLIDCALACLAPHRPRGRRVAIVGDGGGTGVVTADLVTEAGLELPTLSPELASRLTAIAPTIVTANPVDLAGAGEQDFWNFERVNTAVLESGEVDAVIFTGLLRRLQPDERDFATVETEVGHAIARAAGASGRPLLAQAMFWDSAPARALREGGVPVYRDIEAVVDTLGRLVRRHEERAHGVPDVGTPAPPITGDGYFESRELLADGGVAFSAARRATLGRRGARRRGRARLPRRAQGARPPAQVGRGRGRARPRRRRSSRRGCGRHARAPGADRLLGRDDGRHREAASS